MGTWHVSLWKAGGCSSPSSSYLHLTRLLPAAECCQQPQYQHDSAHLPSGFTFLTSDGNKTEYVKLEQNKMQFINHNASLPRKLSSVTYARREIETWLLSHFTYKDRRYFTFTFILQCIKKKKSSCQSLRSSLFFFLLVTFPGLTVTTYLAHFNHRCKILKTVFKNRIFHIKAFERPLML